MGGCSGPLRIYGGGDKKEDVFVGVRGPPVRNKFTLGVWGSESHFEKEKTAVVEIDLLRISNIQPHSLDANIFLVHYADDQRKMQQCMFRSLDRSRAVWIELLQTLIRLVREKKNADKKAEK